MDRMHIEVLGDELFAALRSGNAIEPLIAREPDITVDDAYRIQLRMIERRIAQGERVVGKKIGITSKVVMDMLKVDRPDFGHLTSQMALNQGEPVQLSRLIKPRAEVEIAFILKEDLSGPGVNGADVLRATHNVMPCFEIVDSRIRDWKIGIYDTIADNASSGLFVLGDRGVDPREVDLELAGMWVEKNGELIATGAGAAALGSPLNSVAWLANTLGSLGMPLKAGEVILSGSLSPLIPIAPGDCMHASIGGIGAVSAKFI